MSEERIQQVVELICRIAGLPVTPADVALSVNGTAGGQAARREALRVAVLQALAQAPVRVTAPYLAACVRAARPDLFGTAEEIAAILDAECGRGGGVMALPAGSGVMHYCLRRRRRSTGRIRLAPNGVPMPPPDPGRPPVRPPGP
jgi:hypothetical protein